jgi:hypothetical protein
MSAATTATIVLSSVAAASGVTGTCFGIRSFFFNRSTLVRNKQDELRKTLRDLLIKQGRLSKAVHNLESRMPARDPLRDDLNDLRNGLLRLRGDLLVPTRQQIDNVIASIDASLDTWEEVTSVPEDDSIFLADVEKGERDRLGAYFQVTLDQVNCMLNGLKEMDLKVLSRRKQQRLFKELDTPGPPRGATKLESPPPDQPGRGRLAG